MKPITITAKLRKKALQEFSKYLDSNRSQDGKLNFQMSFAELLKQKAPVRPLVTMTPLAFTKMQTLIKKTKGEVAWHGTVERLDKHNFRILDVLCYPQTVTAVTVVSDDIAYPKWLMELQDDEINKLRFQGHSHVSMGVTPSGVDQSNWDEFLQNIGKNDYYIFCIGNVQGLMYWTIYDLATNTIYENTDIDFGVEVTPEYTVDAWYDDIKADYIKEPVVKPYVYASALHSTPSPLKDKIIGGYAQHEYK